VFDQFDRRTNLSVFDGALLLSSTAYGFDAASRLLSVNDGNGNSAGYSYLANSSLIGQINFTNNGALRMTTTKNWDNLNRLTSISSTPSASYTLPFSFSYTYNLANQRTQDTLNDGSYWQYGYDPLGQVTNGWKFFSDGTRVAGQTFDYLFDTIGNRQQSQAGGNTNGASLRVANYTNNVLNQVVGRDIPAYVDIMGASILTNAVTVAGQTAYRKQEYFRQQIPVSNLSTSVWTNIVVTGGQSVSGNVYVAKEPEIFSYDQDGNLLSDGRWNYTWDLAHEVKPRIGYYRPLALNERYHKVRYAWNFTSRAEENRLIQMTANTSIGPQYELAFTYDWQGRRIQKVVSTNAGFGYIPQSTNLFGYDGWNLVASGSTSLYNTYVWGLDLSGSPQGSPREMGSYLTGGAGGVGGLLEVSCHGTQTTNTFAAHDGNGNVMALVNSADGTLVAG